MASEKVMFDLTLNDNYVKIYGTGTAAENIPRQELA